MPFAEDPAHLSKSRLKSDLVAHNVSLPPAASKKEALVELHVKHIDQKRAADFSSDEEEDQHVAEDGEQAGESIDLSCLTDDELRATLLKYGFKAGPIVASTRTLYEKNLRNLLLSDGYEPMNEKSITVTYSDSEEDGEEEEKVQNEDQDDEESGSEETDESEQVQQESSEIGAYFYPQCFSLSSRLLPTTSRKKEPISRKNSRNALKSSTQTQLNRSQIAVGITRASSIKQRAGLASGASSGFQPDVTKGRPSCTETFSVTEMLEKMESRSSPSTHSGTQMELNGSNTQKNWPRSKRLAIPVTNKYEMRSETLHYARVLPQKSHTEKPKIDVLKDILQDTQVTPTGLYVTCRKPIKGAAQRPIQYEYPDTPVSPATFERREVERRLVPMHIRILVFFFLVFILYLIHINV